MDPWLTNVVKSYLQRPCLATAEHIGKKLENRRSTGQPIGETALTEEFVDSFLPSSSYSLWQQVIEVLRKEFGFYLNIDVRKSTIEPKTGVDIGLIIRRSVYKETRSSAEYAVLIQCKKVDDGGAVNDFFHTVPATGKRQSALMLSITPASFYFLYVPPSLLVGYTNTEIIGFIEPAVDCHVPVWNIGAMPSLPVATRKLSTEELVSAASILVVPALAVEAQQSSSKGAKIQDLLPNALPFWYWFAEVLIPGFVGDIDQRVIEVARNVRREELERPELSVRYSISVGVGTG